MRRQFVSVTFAGLALATTTLGASSASAEPSVGAPAPGAVQRVGFTMPAVRDESTMVVVGSALIGLAAVLRRFA